MKKLITVLLAVLMLVNCFAFTASMADAASEGVFLGDSDVYRLEKDLSEAPMTIEAEMYFESRRSTAGGTVFGNYHQDGATSNMRLYIDNKGYPSLQWRGSNGNNFGFTFNQVCVFKGEWLHLAITRDMEAKEMKCYINGELKQTLRMYSVTVEEELCGYVVAGDRSYHNPDYFQGRLKSLAVYSDVRTEAEVKADMSKLDTSNLLVGYDMSKMTGNTPDVLTDLSKNKNDAVRDRFWFDDPRDPVTSDEYAYSFAIVGDPQKMTCLYPEKLKDIYGWIYDNIESKNIEMVITLGDLTEHYYEHEAEICGTTRDKDWQTYIDAANILGGYAPHIMIRGNHDDLVMYNRYMKQTSYPDIIDGRYMGSRVESSYVEMEIGGVPYLFLTLDYLCTHDTLAWANKTVESYPNHNVIVIRHAYLNHDGNVLPDNNALSPAAWGAKYAGCEATWEDFVSQHENIVMVLSGHIGSDTVVTSDHVGVHGNTVKEILVDFQSSDPRVDGGVGAVTMFYFSEDGKEVKVENYSTAQGKYMLDSNQFTMELDMYNDVKYVKPEKEPVPARTEAKPTEIKMTVGNMTGYVNGEAVTLDAAPVIRNDRTMLPVRFVAENLGATVGWDGTTSTVTVKSADTTIEIVIGATTAKVNGKSVTLDSPAYIDASNNRTYLPVRFVSENLGATVGWDGTTSTVTLTK